MGFTSSAHRRSSALTSRHLPALQARWSIRGWPLTDARLAFSGQALQRRLLSTCAFCPLPSSSARHGLTTSRSSYHCHFVEAAAFPAFRFCLLKMPGVRLANRFRRVSQAAGGSVCLRGYPGPGATISGGEDPMLAQIMIPAASAARRSCSRSGSPLTSSKGWRHRIDAGSRGDDPEGKRLSVVADGTHRHSWRSSPVVVAVIVGIFKESGEVGMLTGIAFTSAPWRPACPATSACRSPGAQTAG